MTLYSFFPFAGGGFKRKWNQAVVDYRADGQKHPVTGPWIGNWHTETNGHKGALQCLIEPGSQEPHYEFRFHATWGPFFRCGYHVTFDVFEAGDHYQIEGAEDLGMFGTYEFRGTISGDSFTAEYSSNKGDKGIFEMSRPQI